MTSNIGSSIIQESFENLGDFDRESVIEKTKIELFGLLRKTIRPEFLNRIDETIMFTTLTKNDITAIVKLQLNSLAKLLTKNNITLSYTDEAVAHIAEIGCDPQFGARPVKRVLQKNILNELSKQLLAGKVQPESDIILDQFEGQFVFRNKTAEKV